MKYSWTDTVYKAFSKTFPRDYGDDALCFLHKCIKDEFYQAVKSKEENSLEKLYVCLGDFYKHFCWKTNWKKDSLCSMKKSCLIILSYLIQTGLILSKGKLSLKWINSILSAMKVFPGPLELLYNSLILVHNVKKKCESPFSAVLKHFLFTNKLHVSKTIDYFKIILLLRRLKSMLESKLERAKVVTFALKFTAPSDAQSWLLSHGIENLTNVSNRLCTKILLSSKKLPPEFFIELRNVLEREVQFKEDFYLPNDLKESFVIDKGILNQCESSIEKVAEAPSIKDDSKLLVDPSSSGVSFVNGKRKKDEVTNSSTEDGIDSNALVDPSSPGVSFVNKKGKKFKLTNSSTEDSISSNVVCTIKYYPDTNLISRKNKNRNITTQKLVEESLILPQLFNETKEKVSQELFDQSSKPKETTGNTFSNRELEVDPCLPNDVNDVFIIGTGIVNQYKSPIEVVADAGLIKDDSKMSVDPSFDSYTSSPYVSEKRKKIKLPKTLDTEDCSESNLVNNHLAESDNEVAENSKHRKAQRLKKVSILQPLTPESKRDDNQFKSISESNRKDDQVNSISLSQSPKTKIKHNQQVSFKPCVKANETVFSTYPNSETHSKEKLTDFCEKQNNKRILSNSTGDIPKCMHGDEKEDSVSDSKNKFLKQIELHLSSIKPEDPVKLTVEENNDEIGSYIEGVLYKLVDQVVNKINKAESSWETSEEKSVQLDLTASESSTNTNKNNYETFSVIGNNCQTFSEISKQTTVDCKEYNSLSEPSTKSNLFDYRDDCSKLEVNLNNVSTTEFPESDCGNEDLEEDVDISDDEFHFDFEEHSLDENTQSHDLEIENKNSSQSQVNDYTQSKRDLTFTLEEAENFVAKFPCLSVEVGKRCDGKNTSDIDTLPSDCAEKELTQESEVGNLLLASAESKDLSFTESSHETLLNDPNGNSFLTNKARVENCICDADNHEIVINESDELLGIEVKGTEIFTNRSFKEVLQPVVSIKKLENNCDIYDELKGIENKENLSSVESSIQIDQNAHDIAKENKLELYELSNPPIANDESSLQIHSQDSHEFSNNNTEKDCLVPVSSIHSVLTEHLERPLAVLNSPVKQLRVLRQRKAVVSNPNEILTSLKRKKKMKIDCSDPVLTSNLSQLTLNSPSKTKASQISTEEGKQYCAKLLRKKKVVIQISDSQPESKKGYNLRSRKPLIQPGKLKYPN